jgi:hypothetical protein
MEAKDKAKELVEKFKPYMYPYVGSSYLTGDEFPEQILRYAKQCALIAVDEILQTNLLDHQTHDYWHKVKPEIEKL